MHELEVYSKNILLTIINWHGCIATDVDGSIGIHSETLSFLSVYIFEDLHTCVWIRTDTAPMVVASSGSHKVVGPNTEEK